MAIVKLSVQLIAEGPTITLGELRDFLSDRAVDNMPNNYEVRGVNGLNTIYSINRLNVGPGEEKAE